MATVLNPYLHFDGQAQAAIDFYKAIFGGEVTISHFSDIPGMPVKEGQENLIMHSDLQAGDIRLMISDTPGPQGLKVGNSVGLSLSGEDETVFTKYFEQLSDGGKVTEPLAKAPWGDTFGMVTDKFGISWLININAPKS